MKTKEDLWKLSPSGLYTYEECRACFWIDQHIGRHPSLPLPLNNAMDSKLKERYDTFRRQGKLPPEISHLKNIRLFDDFEKLEEWRTKPTALAYENKQDGYILAGKLDEVFVTDKGEFAPADYKSSGKRPGIDKQKYYRLQLNAYAFMLEKRGYKPSKKAYLLHYFTKDAKDPSMVMEFESHVDEVPVDLRSFEKTLRDIVELLNRKFPGAKNVCGKCAWAEKRKKH